MFSATARFYDRIYGFKDYASEAIRVRSLLDEHARRPVHTLLDVACGTGLHLSHLERHLTVEGLDLDPGLLAVARERLPAGVPLHEGDMTDFDLERTFDAVTCLFSSIGYLLTPERIEAASRCFARHLEPGGVCLIEPWIRPDRFLAGIVHLLSVDDGELPTIARMVTNEVEGRRATLFMEYLVGEPGHIEHFREVHETYLATDEELAGALQAAGLEPRILEEGLTQDRGLLVGVKG